MLAFHSYWTPPWQGKPLEMWDFEWLTWLGSILTLRAQASRTVLVTDSVGEEYVNRTGLGQFYDLVVSTDNLVPACVNPKLFWAAGKLYAAKKLADMGLDSHSSLISVDLDCIPWVMGPGATNKGHHIKVLNRESLSFEWYRGVEDRYSDMFVGKKMRWDLSPVNSGFVQFQCPRHFRSYANKSIEFMEKFSKKMVKSKVADLKYFNDAMMFAEQFLLPVWADEHKYEIRALLTSRNDGFLPINDFVTHLWSSKVFYKAFPEARVHYVNELVNRLLSMDPRVKPVLKQHGLLVKQKPPLTPSENQRINRQNAHTLHRRYPTVTFVSSLEGEGVIRDRNIGGTRALQIGSPVLPGDRIILAQGSRIRLDLPVVSEYLD